MKFFGTLAVSLFFAVSAQATVTTTLSCSESALNAAFAAAAAGDTIKPPAASVCTHSTQLVITKPLTFDLNGATLIDNVPKTGGADSIWLLVTGNFDNVRVTNGTIRGLAPEIFGYNKGHIVFSGIQRNMRADHIKFENNQTSIFQTRGCVGLLIDHLTVLAPGNTYPVVFPNSENCGGSNFGDYVWSQPFNYASPENALVLEDSDIRFTERNGAVSDCFYGGILIIRHTVFYNGTVASHGTDTGQRARSCRAMDIGWNTFDFGPNLAIDSVGWTRGGTGVWHDNVVRIGQDGWLNMMVKALNCRDYPSGPGGCGLGGEYIPWKQCDGTSPFDLNLAGGAGYRCVDQPGSGTSRDLGGIDPLPLVPVNNTLDPIYEWNNSVISNPLNWGMISGSPHVVANRDYYIGTAKPGYIPLIYPHPWSTGSTPIPPDPTPIPPEPINQPPIVSFSVPVNGQIITTKSLMISIVGHDDVGVAWLALQINGVTVKSGAFTTMTYSWNTNPYKGKLVTLKAVVTDADGMTGESLIKVTVKK